MVTDVTLHTILLVRLIKNWYSQTIGVKKAFLYVVIEEEIYTKIPKGIEEVLEEYYNYKYILTLMKYIYGIVQSARCRFKEYIKTIILKVGFKQCKTDPCPLNRVNELGTVIVIIYVYYTLGIGDKPSLMNIIECIKK